jgi:hypothetical protein
MEIASDLSTEDLDLQVRREESSSHAPPVILCLLPGPALFSSAPRRLP